LTELVGCCLASMGLIAGGSRIPKVYLIEIVESLGRQAVHLLNELGYRNVEVRIGDGYPQLPVSSPCGKTPGCHYHDETHATSEVRALTRDRAN
jgi:hypothetical protein